MSGYNSPVDEPPGKDGTQGVNNPDSIPDPPEWPPGANPPGTNPPVTPAEDPATTPIPGSVPNFDNIGNVPPAPGPEEPPPEEPPSAA